VLTTGELYRDLGGDYFQKRDPERQTKRLIRQLEALGHTVTLQPTSTTQTSTAEEAGQENNPLDLDMASAICPNCHILLVEAASSSLTNLGTAVNTAATLGANAISNSYGGGESSSETSWDTSYYNHPGIAVTASSGDNGYGVEYPAASR
jgi:subtilase family serine protease